MYIVRCRQVINPFNRNAMKKQNHFKDSQIHCKGKTIILQLDAARQQLGRIRSKEAAHKHIIRRNREQIMLIIVDIAQLFSETDAWMDVYACLKEAGIKLPKNFVLNMQAIEDENK